MELGVFRVGLAAPPPLKILMDHGFELTKNTPQHTHPKLELLMGDFGTSDMSLSIILLPSHGVLCVVSRCVETTAVSPADTV